ncbi:carbonic anhydrase [Rhexocercosporidium sp. MPI-PUGE-AT-0058]|nr:carbonic anhydrase [Rhexocercosporidium sp. MPI-PUGE-AT-0058]
MTFCPSLYSDISRFFFFFLSTPPPHLISESPHFSPYTAHQSKQISQARITKNLRPNSNTMDSQENLDNVSQFLKESQERIFVNNKAWVDSKVSADSDFFAKLSSGQKPDYLYIGCSDSRVPANEIMGLDAGEVFVHRNIANLVPNTDLNVMSVIEYAVAHLHVKHIVVCGHYICGGVQAALSNTDMGLLNPWLRGIRDVYRLHEKELDTYTDAEAKYRRLIELNVLEQCRNVIKTAVVQQSYTHNGYPIVHAWVFDLKDGLLKDLKLDFEECLKEIKKIYDLDAGPKKIK